MGTGHYTLPVSGFRASGGVNISVSKNGYEFENTPYEVPFTFTNDVVFYLASPIQTAGKTTSLLLYFSNNIDPLNASNISLKNKTTGESLNAIKGALSHVSVGVYELGLTGNAKAFQKELPITVTVTSDNAYLSALERDAVLKYLYEIVDPAASDLMVKFGIKQTTATAHTTTDVTLAFNALHAYINDSGVFSSDTLSGSSGNVVRLGDFIDLPSLHVTAYVSGGTINESYNTVFSGSSGTLLRVIVVGINSFNRRGEQPTDYVDTPHVVFQFQNIPGTHRAHPYDGTSVAYYSSEMRGYIIGNYLTGLKNAGVPDNCFFVPKRAIFNGTSGVDIISDRLWLPTEREIFNAQYYSQYETEDNQAYLEYYNTTIKRYKFLKSGDALAWWLSSRSSSNNIYSTTNAGTFGVSNVVAENGIAPAFCIK
jgi:hypothetical protein